MKDEDIEKLLRELPRQKASPDFTPRLLGKLEKPPSSPTTAGLGARSLIAAAASLMLLVALTSGLRYWSELRERSESARRVEALRDEYEALERELEELRSLAAASQPVVDLGGTEDLDILLDLRAITAGTGRDGQAQHQPVEYRR
ncbi:MAG TPA: hypothetical protein VGC53_20720 [Vicinamibacteria bacterium]|jgi:hypothetical protein